MNNTLIAFLLTFIAGFSTMLGVLVIYIKSKNHNKIIMASLSFAAGVMITVSITDLIPESILLFPITTILYFYNQRKLAPCFVKYLKSATLYPSFHRQNLGVFVEVCRILTHPATHHF